MNKPTPKSEQWLEFQFSALEDEIKGLEQPTVMLNVLHNRTKLNKVEDCELEEILKGIELLLLHHANNLKRRVAFIQGKEVENDFI